MSTSEHSKSVKELIEVLDEHEGWSQLLASSIRDACVKAKDKLNRDQQRHEAKGNAFTQWMVDFANDWGSFLNTSESLTRDSLLSFYDDPTFNLLEYVGSVEEPDDDARWAQAQVTWKSFNQFFSRETKPGLRPVAGMFDDRIICAPADFTFKMKSRIDNDSRITVKHTHSYSVIDLLAGSDVTITSAPGIHTNAGMCIGEVIHSTV